MYRISCCLASCGAYEQYSGEEMSTRPRFFALLQSQTVMFRAVVEATMVVKRRMNHVLGDIISGVGGILLIGSVLVVRQVVIEVVIYRM